MSTFDTGDNAAIKEGALQGAMSILVRMGYEFIRELRDLKGIYGYLLRFQGLGVYLVARRARPFEVNGVRYISSQKTLINFAAGQPNGVILVALWGEEECSFYMFDPHELKRIYAADLLDTKYDNLRMGSKMVNYEWDLGVGVNPMNLVKTRDEIQLARAEKRKYSKVNEDPVHFGSQKTLLTEGEILLQNTMRQHVSPCPGCGIMISNKIPKCPECGANLEELRDA